ncbi:DUF2188 domain-containing protein [Planococcus sp. YIM B11945]|uniref:DUF2188 domain-containing protein n=1 Tax=Planococcus sp. YIM B11945 TaxID=3435410 RepID=UPI003D7C3C17
MADSTEQRDEYLKGRPRTGKARFHVMPDDDGWAVRKEGEEEILSIHASKLEAAEEAKRLAKEASTVAFLHYEGKLENKRE